MLTFQTVDGQNPRLTKWRRYISHEGPHILSIPRWSKNLGHQTVGFNESFHPDLLFCHSLQTLVSLLLPVIAHTGRRAIQKLRQRGVVVCLIGSGNHIHTLYIYIHIYTQIFTYGLQDFVGTHFLDLFSFQHYFWPWLFEHFLLLFLFNLLLRGNHGSDRTQGSWCHSVCLPKLHLRHKAM